MAFFIFLIYCGGMFYWLRSQDGGFAFAAGKLYRDDRKKALVLLLGVPAAFIAYALISPYIEAKIPLSASEVSAAKASQEAKLQAEAKRKKAADDVEAALKLKCVDNIEALIQAATKELKEKNPQWAAAELGKCAGVMTEPRAIALREKSVQASAAKVQAEKLALEKEIRAAKKKEGVRIGMSMQDVIDSQWGRPEKVNKTTNAHGTHEQWVYGSGGYLYFDNGVLTSIQN
jgi:hypothetical protein